MRNILIIDDDEELFSLIAINIRGAVERRADLQAQFEAAKLIDNRVKELCERYGVNNSHRTLYGAQQFVQKAASKPRAAQFLRHREIFDIRKAVQSPNNEDGGDRAVFAVDIGFAERISQNFKLFVSRPPFVNGKAL